MLLQVLIGVDGAAHKVEIKQSSGFERLDQAAGRFAQQTRSRPASKTQKSDSRPSDLGIFARFDATDADRTEALPVFHDGHTPL